MNKLQKEVKQYLVERDWDHLRPGDLAKSVAIEAGELLEIFQWDNSELESVLKDKEKIEKIKKEVADVLIYCYDICVELNLDVEEVIRQKLKKIQEKYPAHMFKNNGVKEQGTQELYWKIKREHRQKGD